MGIPSALLSQPIEVLRQELAQRKKYHPAKSFVPNIGQQRFLEFYRKVDGDYGDYPKLGFFFGGNGVGKTALCFEIFTGVCLGRHFVNEDWLSLDFFDHFSKIRKSRKVKIRIVCNKADVEPNGSVTEQIQKWCPLAVLKKPNGVYYQSIIVPSSDPSEKDTLVDIKTHDQAVTAHAGPDYDLILYNEPPPAPIFAENQGRLRNGGYSMAFLTPLAMVAYMQRIVDGDYPVGEVVHTRASIWDNCKDLEGTRGVLSERNIRAQIRQWRQINPHEVVAREEGKFMHMAGSVFKIFSESSHVVAPIAIESDWNIFHCVDPHPNRPHCSSWLALTPQNVWYVIAEYPTGMWSEYTGTIKTISDFGKEFKMIERGEFAEFPYFKTKAHTRFGDPNGFKAQSQSNRKTVQSEYSDECGLDFEVSGVNNDIELGHNRIKTLLSWDSSKVKDSFNSPRLYIFSSCKNHVRAFKYYSEQSKRGKMGEVISGKYEGVWKDWIDNIRYITTSIDLWEPMASKGFFDQEWEDIESGESDVFEPHAIDWVV